MVPVSKKLIYLDHAATTPVRPEVLRAMQPFWSTQFGNPSALYKLGLEAKAALNEARQTVAGALGVRGEEIIFTAGGSESVNLALFGAARQYRSGRPKGGHIITSVIEHHAVLRAVEALEAEGFTVTRIGVNKEGVFNLEELERAVRPDTFLVSLMYANNEIGTVEPIAEIGRLIKKINSGKPARRSPILFHTDACQGAGYLDLSVEKLHVDMLTLNGSKIYGPKQTGCLYVRKGTQLSPIIYGGGQERNLRSGTENVPGAVGFATALRLAQTERVAETKRLSALQAFFIEGVLKSIPLAHLNGPMAPQKKRGQNTHTPELLRLPNNVHLSFPGVDGEALVLYLDAHNIAAATGSACSTDSTDPSHVLLAIGLQKRLLRGSVRFTFGAETTKQELQLVLRVLPALIEQQRGMTKQI
jgi:cysteine desulfurase